MKCSICKKELHFGVEYDECGNCGFIACWNCTQTFEEECPKCNSVNWTSWTVPLEEISK